jgi:hypothetical protein
MPSTFWRSTVTTCAACRCPCASKTSHSCWRVARTFAAPFEQGEIGPDLLRLAYRMGLEGLVSKRADRHCRASKSEMPSTPSTTASPSMKNC